MSRIEIDKHSGFCFGVVKAINKMIEAVNDVADHVPGIDDGLIPTIPELHLPRLAQGGFVKANTPQLAMIGDNRHYGEIVAPEDKMQEMADRAAESGVDVLYISTELSRYDLMWILFPG